jgi:hypothetical protein
MYDAINRGLRRARGEILAYLNCDEQYLPGALTAVSAFFDEHPDVDVLFAYAIVVDERGDYICHRKTLLPRENHVLVSHLPTFTAATFFRRTILDRGFFFDARFRASGDADWVCRMLRGGVRMAVLRRFIAAFTDTGHNMALNSRAVLENEQLRASAPIWAQKLEFALVLQHRIRRLTSGIYRQAPFDYSIYTSASPTVRVSHHVERPTFLWGSRLSGVTRLLSRMRNNR